MNRTAIQAVQRIVLSIVVVIMLVMPVHKKPVSRRGLSLLELLVVLTILIALGGIVVSTLPGMLERTQVATAAANVPEIDAAIRRNALLNQGEIGNRFDSLIAGTGALDGEVIPYISGLVDLQAISLNASEIQALAEVGVTELVPAFAETENATFDSHVQLPVEIGNDATVCALANDIAFDLLRQNWNFEPDENSRYVLFGIGAQCSLVGAGTQAVFSESPIHFSDNRNQSPQKSYSRYLMLLELKTITESRSQARYIGIAIPGTDGIHSVSKSLENYYEQ